MKHIFYFLFLLIINFGYSQILEPIKWSTSVVKISNTEAVLVAKADIDKGWHLYSQSVPEDGPVATTFTFTSNKNYLKKGNTREENGHTINDPIFEMKITYFENQVLFKQTIKLKNKKAFTVNAVVEFMVCDDTRCLPPTEVDLKFEIE